MSFCLLGVLVAVTGGTAIVRLTSLQDNTRLVYGVLLQAFGRGKKV